MKITSALEIVRHCMRSLESVFRIFGTTKTEEGAERKSVIEKEKEK